MDGWRGLSVRGEQGCREGNSRGDAGVPSPLPCLVVGWRQRGAGVGRREDGDCRDPLVGTLRTLPSCSRAPATSCCRIDAGADVLVCQRGGLRLWLAAPGLVGGKPNEDPGLCWRCGGYPRSPWQSITGGQQGAGATVPEQGTQVAGGSGDGGDSGVRRGAVMDGARPVAARAGVSVGLLRPQADLSLAATGLSDRSLDESQRESFPGGKCLGTGTRIWRRPRGIESVPHRAPQNIGVCLRGGVPGSPEHQG